MNLLNFTDDLVVEIVIAVPENLLKLENFLLTAGVFDINIDIVGTVWYKDDL
jgi:hypothetical protein